MKHLSKDILKRQEINWVKEGESVPFVQGAALNMLNSQYPASYKHRSGWFLYSERQDDDENPTMDQACYYLIQRVVNLNGDLKKRYIAFKENGDSVEGYAIFI